MEQSINNTQKEFKEIQNIIVTHRNRAYQLVNYEGIVTNWEVGKYVSDKLKNSHWGTSVVDNLVNFLKQEQPDLKGFDRRAIYRMIQFYETYSTPEFVAIATPQIEYIDKQQNTIVAIESPQFDNKYKVLTLLTLINWSSHIEILSGCKLDEERIFYILLSHNV
ncbi:DUF1016 N-terminal domain-containing protein [Dysgonomonas sp. ZJ279]|uniref:DUF1016 N-terminal domain-containing protein n=1 Tax=Dysgonomonas sp. ZJ279 TaxID=2709796 RepID=UPI0013EC1A71|nr:DUF1016 N-terminal domain-containing protein [Dysgonomonas sp. ZJ279]